MFTKINNIIKNITTIFVVFSLCFSFSYSSVQAQGVGAGGSGSITSSLNIQGIGAVALQCVSTNLGGNSPFGQAVGSAAGGAAGGAVGQSIGGETGQQIGTALGTFAGGVAGDAIGGTVNNLIENAQDAPQEALEGAISSVPVVGGLAGQGVPVEVVEDSKQAENIDEATKKQVIKEECLDRIAQWAAITVMDKMTLATLNWINSGFEGGALYLEEREKFMSIIAIEEILGFSATFSADSNLYPFGETLVRTVLTSFQRTFEQNMINSLNTVLAHGTRVEWEQNFSIGGWAGYTAFLEPNNNIFGSYIESSANLQRNLQGTFSSQAINIQAELQEGSGFLSQKVCTQTQNGGEYIPRNHIRHIPTNVGTITNINQIPTDTYMFLTSCDVPFDTDGDGEEDSNGECIDDIPLVLEIAEDYRQRSNCLNWRTVTPGNQIADSLTRAIANPQEQLLLVDEFNENLGLIFDALLLQLVNEGVAAFTEDNPNNVVLQQVNGENPGQQPDTVSFIEAINGSLGSGEEDFSGLIPIQEQYIEDVQSLIALQTEVFQRTLDLDYCIPGPNPSWQSVSSESLSEAFLALPAYESYAQSSWIQITPALFLPGLAVIGTFLSTNNPDVIEDYLHDIYESLIFYFTGLSGNLGGNIISRDSQTLPMLFDLFSDYASFINQRFILANDFSGNVRGLAYEYFFDLGTINQSIIAYENSLTVVQQNLNNLIELREEYADIERDYIVEWLQTAVNQQGIQTLQDNLQTFQAFSDAAVTYISSNEENTPYHNAVIALTAEVGQPVVPPSTYPGYQPILQELVQLLPNTVFESQLDAVIFETGEALEKIGNPSDQNSLIGLTYSCIQQVNQPNFNGFEERRPYPFPLSNDIPGLLSLPTTETFLEDIGIEHDNQQSATHLTLPMIPADDIGNGVNESNTVKFFEDRFINIGQNFY